MKEEILSEIRSFVFRGTITKVSSMLDQYRAEVERQLSESEALLRDQVNHLHRALTMISEVPETIDGATMAKGIAKEALSTL
jgi:hypothetical protein